MHKFQLLVFSRGSKSSPGRMSASPDSVTMLHTLKIRSTLLFISPNYVDATVDNFQSFRGPFIALLLVTLFLGFFYIRSANTQRRLRRSNALCFCFYP
jgi:hypothetical protein